MRGAVSPDLAFIPLSPIHTQVFSTAIHSPGEKSPVEPTKAAVLRTIFASENPEHKLGMFFLDYLDTIKDV